MVVLFQIYLPEAISMTQTKATVKSATAAIPTTKIRQIKLSFICVLVAGLP